MYPVKSQKDLPVVGNIQYLSGFAPRFALENAQIPYELR